MSIEQYHQDLQLDIKSTAVALGNYERVQFTEIALEKLAEAGEVSDLTLSQFEGHGRNRKKLQIDAFGFDSVDESLVCVVTDYSSLETIQTITKTEVDSLLGDLKAFIEIALDDDQIKSLEHSSEGAQAAFDIRAKIHTAARVRAYLITNRKLSDRIKGINDSTVELKRLEFSVWDLERFHSAHTSSLGREEIDIDITRWLPEGLPALKAETKFQNVDTYLAVIPGRVLAEIYDKYGSRLLEGNVRSFLSVRGAVNKGIRATILGAPEQFLAFNNGLSTTATSITSVDKGEVASITAIRDLQIVNGGQTTASLFAFMRQEREKNGNLDEVSVQMKLIVVPAADAEELVPKIARYANTQNRISETDFFSNSPFHVRMEDCSRRLNAGPKSGEVSPTRWFYERARGSYLNEKNKLATTAEERKFEKQYPRSQVITKTDLAKYYNSWNQKPHIVSRGAQKNFLEFAGEIADKFASESGRAMYGDEFFKQIVCQALIFEHTHKAVRMATWYETGYLANIVTYALAKVAHELKNRNLELSWGTIWRSQTISDGLEKALLDAAVISVGVFNDPTRVQKNISEWAKMEACWKLVRDSNLAIDPEFLETLESATSEERRDRKKVELENGKLLGELEKIKILLSVSSASWEELLASNSISVSPVERSIISGLRRQGFVSERQADKLLAVIQRAKNEGMLFPF